MSPRPKHAFRLQVPLRWICPPQANSSKRGLPRFLPELVRLLLKRGNDHGVAASVSQTLWLSACGGGRGFTEGELNPEYRYILTEAESLANRFRDDPVLAPFYRKIAESERTTQAQHRERVARDDEDR